MPEYAVSFARSARKELEKLSSPLLRRIVEHIERLRENPRPSGVIKLQGARNLWRMRVGDYRIIYEIDDTKRFVDISAVRHRRDAYRQR